MITIRDANEIDHDRILEIENTLFPDDYRETPEEFQHHRRRMRAGGYVDAFVVAEGSADLSAADLSAGIVGFAYYSQMPEQTDPNRFRTFAGVVKEWRGRRVGVALSEHVQTALRARGATAAESFAREGDRESIGFLERRGFREVMRAWELRLDPSRFDPAPFAMYAERARAAGATITTLAAERARDPDAMRKAYELHNDVDSDIPSVSPFQAPPFERFLENNVNGPNALVDGYFIAKIGDEYVGESTLRKPGTGTHLAVNTTGVRRGYRGRGIAMALKLASIEYARAHGCSHVRTWNEINNVGMLAINERLGFVRTPAWITLEKRFAGRGPA